MKNTLTSFSICSFVANYGQYFSLEAIRKAFPLSSSFLYTSTLDRPPLNHPWTTPARYLEDLPSSSIQCHLVNISTSNEIVNLDSPSDMLFIPDCDWDNLNFISLINSAISIWLAIWDSSPDLRSSVSNNRFQF